MGFQCRQFYLKDDQCAMKVSTDSLLFGAWVEIAAAQRLLDLGTGCGILALMLAQRSMLSAHIDAVELDARAAAQAQENVNASPWPKKVTVVQGDVAALELPVTSYDVIVMNPPYFAGHLASPTTARQLARQGHGQVWRTWLACAHDWLSPVGKIAVVAPMTALQQILTCAASLGLCVSRQCQVHSTPSKPAYLVMLELRHESAHSSVVHETMIIRDATGAYTAVFKTLTKDFYLS